MKRNYKSGGGLCVIALQSYGDPVIIYRVDENGNPVLNENEILIAKPGEINTMGQAKVGLHGKAYQFVRYGLLEEENYDSEKSNLSKEETTKLKKIVDGKLKKIKSLDELNFR